MTSHSIQHTKCPRCASIGKDRHGDNLALYSDGHSHCFSCGYTLFPNARPIIQKEAREEREVIGVFLPEDCSVDYPQRAIDWISGYELSKNDLLNHNVLWSEKGQRLIFPVYNKEGDVLLWQGRDFKEPKDTTRAKWFGIGDFKNTINVLGTGTKCFLVEDVVSAIKISLIGAMAIPIYGSHISQNLLKRLYRLYGDKVEVDVWLDPDKRKEALLGAKLGRIYGLRCSTVMTGKDPKEESFKKIKEIILGE